MRAPRLALLPLLSLLLLPLLPPTAAQSESTDDPAYLRELQDKWGFDYGFSGISTFAHLPHTRCLVHPSERYDVAVIGAPFDTAVSYRPGARFGPRAIRAASARQSSFRGFNAMQGVNPYLSWAKILDCGDIPVTPFDNALALQQMTEAMTALLQRSSHASTPSSSSSTTTTPAPPRLIALGGDHSIALATLRALHSVYGPVSVLHFDAHLDTWHPSKYPLHWTSAQSAFTHGTMFQLAANESLVATPSVHAGLRTRLSGADFADYDDDDRLGWRRIATDDIDVLGAAGVVDAITHALAGKRVYLSFDIDVIDPGLAPGTGTPEAGGWTTREALRILRGVVKELDIVAMDMVEVAPGYDGAGEATALAASQIVFEVLSGMVKAGPTKPVVDGNDATKGATKGAKDEL